METKEVKAFRKKHDCMLCLYYKKMKRCEGLLICPLEVESKKEKRKSCPLDVTGNCPYKNDAGTCFGFCVKNLLRPNEKGNQYEQTKEDKESG